MSARHPRLCAGAAAALCLAVSASPAAAQTIRIGQSVSGSLTDSDRRFNDKSYFDEFTFAGQAGQRIRITLRSPTFDTYLILGTGTGSDFEEIESDDDSAGDLDSQIDATLPRSGTYTVRANSAAADQFGTYTLSVQSVGGSSAAPVKGGAPTPSRPSSGRDIMVCVVQDGAATEVRALYDTETGDTTVNGRRFRDVFGGVGYAVGAAWYTNNEAIPVNGRRFVKYGLPRVLGPREVTRFGEFRSVTVFQEAGSGRSPEVVYLPVRYGCEFQPYQVEVR